MDTLREACGGDFGGALFRDETGAMTNVVRPHGRSAQGSRCVAFAPNGHSMVMTAVAPIRLGGLSTSATMVCPMDGRLFQVYLEQALLRGTSTPGTSW